MKNIDFYLDPWTLIKMSKIENNKYLFKLYTDDKRFIIQFTSDSIHLGVQLARVLQHPKGKAA